MPARLRGAAGAQRAAAAGGAEGGPAAAADRAGHPVRAGRGAGGVVDGEVVDGEPARHGRAHGCGFDPVDVAALGEFGAELAGAVSGIGQHRHRCVLAVQQRRARPRRCRGCRPPLALVSAQSVMIPVSGSIARWALNPSWRRVHRLVRVPGLGVDGGDHPVRGDPPGDPPPPVGAVGALDRFHVLAGDQRQQRHRLGGPRAQFLLGQVPQQPVRIADQRVDQLLPGRLRRPRRSPVYPGRRSRARCSVRRSPRPRRAPRGAPGGSPRSTGSPCPGWPPRHRAPWNPTPAGSCPPAPRSAATTAFTASKIRFGPIRGRQPPPPIRQRRRVKRPRRHRQPARRLPPQIEGDRVHRLAIGQPVQRLQRDHRGHHIGRHTGRPRPDGNRSANISSGNNSRRCAARNANTLPGFSRCPATDSTSSRSR